MVLELCDRTIVLHDGRVMADVPTLEIFGNEELLKTCRLEKPFAMQSCPICSPGRRIMPVQKPLVAPHGDRHHDHDHRR